MTTENPEGIEARLAALGLVLPEPAAPAGVRLPFSSVRVYKDRAFIAGHGPQNPDGSLAAPLGKLGAEISIEQGYLAARLTALAMLASLKRALGSLDRVQYWLKIFGMVNCTPDFTQQPQVINGCSDLILELYGPDRGAHSRSAVGFVSLPFSMPVEIEAEVAID